MRTRERQQPNAHNSLVTVLLREMRAFSRARRVVRRFEGMIVPRDKVLCGLMPTPFPPSSPLSVFSSTKVALFFPIIGRARAAVASRLHVGHVGMHTHEEQLEQEGRRSFPSFSISLGISAHPFSTLSLCLPPLSLGNNESLENSRLASAHRSQAREGTMDLSTQKNPKTSSVVFQGSFQNRRSKTRGLPYPRL